jgi:hypothetical protein
MAVVSVQMRDCGDTGHSGANHSLLVPPHKP